ncbi:MAG: T9SS type A sorting domain-containing protein [Bacteroidales bacterium]|nr:T9SS type A sorting domain-containing protein [Bacteroidales bacterium]
MKNKKFTLTGCLIGLLTMAGFAQTIVDVAPNGVAPENAALDVVVAEQEDTINGTVFVLERNGVYILDGQINGKADITFKAAEGEGNRPIVVMGTTNGSQNSWNIASFSSNLTLDGIHFMCANLEHQRGGWANGGINMSTKDLDVSINNCIIDHMDAVFIQAWSGGIGDFTFTNNLVRFNGGPYSGNWHGYIIDCKGGPAGDVYIENNTFMEGMAAILTMDGANYIKSLWINHNTIVNHALFPFSTMWAKEGVMMNNLFVNPEFAGENIDFRANNCNGGSPTGIIDLCTFKDGDDTVSYTVNGETVHNPVEQDRIYMAGYNNNFYSEGIRTWRESNKGLLSSTDTANGGKWWAMPNSPEGTYGFMTDTTFKKFDSGDYEYYYWDETKSVKTLDPGFTSYTWDDNDLIAFARSVTSDPDDSYELDFGSGAWGIGPDTTKLTLPVAANQYNLSYSNIELQGSGYRGYPIGDLNWFPAKKTQWESDVDKEDYDEIVSDIKAGTFEFISGIHEKQSIVDGLMSVFPNPSKGLTTISKKLTSACFVNVTVYNIYGQQIQNLYNSRVNAGTFKISFDSSEFTSGTYLIKLTVNSKSSETKMFVVQ